MMTCALALLLAAEPGRTVRVATVAELHRAVTGARDGDTILVADGEYRLERLLYLTGVNRVRLLGESGDAARVTLLGRGYATVDHQDDILRIGACDGVEVAHLTFADCHAYGIKVQAEDHPREVHIRDCRFRNIGTRMIKGSTSLDGWAVGGSIRRCSFENEFVPPAEWQFGGNYISAIDLMALDGWTIADNQFRDLRGAGGSGRAAIFVWVRSRNVTVERNTIVGCDRGIAFGNPSPSTAGDETTTHVSDSVCRNNVVVAGPDAGIELAWVSGVRVVHNTVWRAEGRGRGIRCIQKLRDVLVAGNLVHGEILVEQDADGVTLRDNHAGRLDGWFIAPPTDLRPAWAMERIEGLAEDDLTGAERPARAVPGAIEP